MEKEAIIRLSVFLGLFALFAALEAWAPRRVRRYPRQARWATNWGIVLVDTLTLRALAVLLPLLAVGAAIDAGANGLGFFNRVTWPPALEVFLAVLFFDLAIWAQHLITHKVPVLWRLHRVHHADIDIDVSTAIRFHPIEIALSMLLKIGLVYVIGPSALAIILFEILLNGTAIFNHANLRLPLPLDRTLRQVLVTPDMHRVHHSVHRHEHDSNYGFALSIWDRVFGTYVPQPEAGHERMQTGLEWQDDRPSRFGWSLALPFFPEMTWADLEERAAPHGLILMGTLHEAGDTIALLGAGPAMWPCFTASGEFADGRPHPLDRWSKRVVRTLCEPHRASAVFPSDGPPYAPFIAWAKASGRFWQSPTGMLIHDRAGLMISLRGALRFAGELPLAEETTSNPCESCADQPCTTACPVGALSADAAYDVPACKAHLGAPEGRDCLSGGCLVRRVCPVSQFFERDSEQSAFHMRAFVAG